MGRRLETFSDIGRKEVEPTAKEDWDLGVDGEKNKSEELIAEFKPLTMLVRE